ncbi:hypothetical protein ABW20_dc0104360 [Dactylellina cionopaga]|nr:hypothetical protein ABW20_dc0104360 [Dactylellina cionopaga]
MDPKSFTFRNLVPFQPCYNRKFVCTTISLDKGSLSQTKIIYNSLDGNSSYKSSEAVSSSSSTDHLSTSFGVGVIVSLFLDQVVDYDELPGWFDDIYAAAEALN